MPLFLELFAILAACASLSTAQSDAPGRIRYRNERIAEVFDYAAKRSSTFRDLVAAIERSDVVVSIVEGACNGGVRSCLHLAPRLSGRHAYIRVDPRQPILSVVRQLAHELQHAVELAGAPDVVDDASLQRLYERIGYAGASPRAWETLQAQIVETAVIREMSTSVPVVDAAFFGTWILDAQPSTFRGVAALVSGTRWQRDRGHGLISIVIEAVDESGAQTRTAFVYRPDGADYVISSTDDEGVRTVAESGIDRYTAAFVVKQDGVTKAAGRRVLDRDGRRLTIESEGVDADGRAWSSVEIWRKQLAAARADGERRSIWTALSRPWR